MSLNVVPVNVLSLIDVKQAATSQLPFDWLTRIFDYSS